MIIKAKNDVNIEEGRDTLETATHWETSKKGFLKKKSTVSERAHSADIAISSNLTGNQVLIGAGNDVNITGSNVVSETQTWIDAKNDININAATNTESVTTYQAVKKSGLMGTGGFGFTIGSAKNTLGTTSSATTHTGSLIASNGGDVKLTSGNTLNIEGSDVIAARNVTGIANDINISNVTDSYVNTSQQTSRSSGLTLSLGGTIGNAANTVVNTIAQSQASAARGNSLLTTAYATKAALVAAQAGQSIYQDVTDVSAANKSKQGSIIGITASIGSSKSRSSSESAQTIAVGSNVAAGNNLTLIATGDGSTGTDGFANSGDLNVTGSNLSGNNVDLSAARDVNFNSAINTDEQHSSNKSSGWGVGATLGISYSGNIGLTAFANVNAAKGHTDGSSVTHTETQVTATDNLNINAGRDLNMTGAQARGTSTDVTVGRNLTITSEQDTSEYESRQRSVSAGVEVPLIGVGVGGFSANVSSNKQRIDSTYNSVNEQSGLFAGAGGSRVSVGGHTQLNGGTIASTASAEFNSLNTGSLGFSDIENQAEYAASSSGFGLSTGGLLNMTTQALSSAIPASNNQSGQTSSTTHASLSDGSITIGGQAASADQLNGLSRDTITAHEALEPIFDLQEVQDNMEAATVVGEIGALATSITARAMTRNEYVALDQAQANYEQNPSAENQAALVIAQDNYTAAQNRVGPGSPFATAAQSLSGLAVGIAGGNVQQGLSNALTPYLAGAVGGYFDSLETGSDGQKHPTPETTAGRLLAHAAVGAAVAYASGGDAASGAAGAVAGEAMAMIVMKLHYPGLTADDLTNDQKEHIRAIATLASGLVGAATGNSFEAATTAAAAGYNAAVNNTLSGADIQDIEKFLDALGPLGPEAKVGFRGSLKIWAKLFRTAENPEAIALAKKLILENQINLIYKESISIAGAGANTVLRDAPRLVSQYGGKIEDWAKVTTRADKLSDGSSIAVHAYKNVKTGLIVEPKFKLSSADGIPY